MSPDGGKLFSMDPQPYNKDLPDYGLLMTVEDFITSVKYHNFIDYDGHGHPVKNGKISSQYIYPSQTDKVPEDATHIMWFNK